MTTTEFQRLMDRAMMLFDDVRRFVASRGDQSGALLAEWDDVMKEIAFDDANAVLDSMLDGSVPRVEFFDMGRFPNLVLRAARLERQNRFERELHQSCDTSGPRLRCHQCRDTGVVSVWNPIFVRQYRERFLAEVDEYSAGWVSRAYQFWGRAKGDNGPMIHVALCNCDCPRQRIQSEERDKYLAGTRRDTHGKPAGPPACGIAKYDPRTMPLHTGEHFRDLTDFYQNELVSEPV